MTSGTDIDGELPEGWRWVPLGELADITGGLTKGKKRNPKDRLREIPYLRVANVQRGYLNLSEVTTIAATETEISQLRLMVGDVLFNEGGDRDKLGRGCVWANEIPECIHQNHVFRARLHKGYEPKYISAYGNSSVAQSYFLNTGKQTTNLASLNMTQLRLLPIPTPPHAEQRRIVKKLESLQARSRRAREALEAVPPLLEKLRQSILAAAFRGDLTADWRAQHPDVEPASELLKRIRIERRQKWEQAELAKLKAKGKKPTDDKWKQKYVEPEPVDDSELPELPEGWVWASVEELSTKVVDGVHSKPNYVPAGIPFLTVKNLTFGPGISFENLNYVSPEDHVEFIKRTDPEFGDLLISKDGTLGVTRLVRTKQTFSIFVSLALVKPALRTMGEYLELAFESPFFQERFKATGSGLQHIHLVDLRSAALPIAPAEEHAAVVQRAMRMLKHLGDMVGAQRDTFDGIRQLDSAILSKAFRGELVPQDPDDAIESLSIARTAKAVPAPQQADGADSAPTTNTPRSSRTTRRAPR